MTVLATVNAHATEKQLKPTSNNAYKPVSSDQIYYSSIKTWNKPKACRNNFKLLYLASLTWFESNKWEQ